MIQKWILGGMTAAALALTGSSTISAQGCPSGNCGGGTGYGDSAFTGGSSYGGETVIGGEVLSDDVYTGDGSYVGDLPAAEAVANGARRSFGQNDLFYNYYTQGYANSANAQMYLSPLPVPANVGHTYSTYQPFHPHHMLYAHKDRYHNYYDNGRGMNRTRALYYYPPARTAVKNLYWNYLRIPR